MLTAPFNTLLPYHCIFALIQNFNINIPIRRTLNNWSDTLATDSDSYKNVYSHTCTYTDRSEDTIKHTYVTFINACNVKLCTSVHVAQPLRSVCQYPLDVTVVLRRALTYSFMIGM